jgi:hypothetical protein
MRTVHTTTIISIAVANSTLLRGRGAQLKEEEKRRSEEIIKGLNGLPLE